MDVRVPGDAGRGAGETSNPLNKPPSPPPRARLAVGAGAGVAAEVDGTPVTADFGDGDTGDGDADCMRDCVVVVVGGAGDTFSPANMFVFASPVVVSFRRSDGLVSAGAGDATLSTASTAVAVSLSRNDNCASHAPFSPASARVTTPARMRVVRRFTSFTRMNCRALSASSAEPFAPCAPLDADTRL